MDSRGLRSGIGSAITSRLPAVLFRGLTVFESSPVPRSTSRQTGRQGDRTLFARLYDTGGMRRTHLRGHTNILKRVLIHAGGLNLGLIRRQVIGFPARSVSE